MEFIKELIGPLIAVGPILAGLGVAGIIYVHEKYFDKRNSQ